MSKPTVYFFSQSFDPFDEGHHSIVIQALKESPGAEIWIAPRYIPFRKYRITLDQRIEIIEKNYKNNQSVKVIKDGFYFINDFVQKYSPDYNLVLVMSEESYNDMPNWQYYEEFSKKIFGVFVAKKIEIPCKEIRENLKICYGKVSRDVYNYLLLNHIEYKKPSITGDAIVQRKDGKILVFDRNTNPFKGSIVFPGGFVDENEHPQNTAVRELAEEVGVQISEGSQVTYLDTFYKTGRDPRGWVITNTYVISLDFDPEGVETTEASNIRWLTLSELEGLEMGFDHKEALNLAISKKLLRT